MGNELFQARVDDDFADRIHERRDEKHMSKSEIVRAALREYVLEDTEDTEDTEPTGTTENQPSLERGYKLAGQLNHAGMILLVMALGGWFSIVLGLTPETLITTLTIGVFSITGILIVLSALVLTAVLYSVETAMNLPLEHDLRWFDLRRVVLS